MNIGRVGTDSELDHGVNELNYRCIVYFIGDLVSELLHILDVEVSCQVICGLLSNLSTVIHLNRGEDLLLRSKKRNDVVSCTEAEVIGYKDI